MKSKPRAWVGSRVGCPQGQHCEGPECQVSQEATGPKDRDREPGWAAPTPPGPRWRGLRHAPEMETFWKLAYARGTQTD